MRLLCTVVAVVALMTSACRPAQSSAEASACGPAPFTAPETLWSARLTAETAHPSTASAAANSMIVMGRELSVPSRPRSDTLFAGLWFRRETKQPEILRRPPGSKFFIDPVAAIDAAGTPHVLWAEPGIALTDSVTAGASPRSVWASSFSLSGWTRPTRVAAVDGMTWIESGQSPIIATDDGTLHFVVPANRSDLPGLLLHLRLTPNGWNAIDIRLPMPAAYSVLGRRGRELLLAYVSPAPSEAGDLNSLWFTRSDDNGVTWAPSVLVSRSRQTGASEPMLAVIGKSVHLVWGQNLSGGLSAEVVRHAESTDGGASWGPAADLATPGFFAMHGAVPDLQGHLQVFYSVAGDSGLSLRRSRWCRGSWSSPDGITNRGASMGSAAVVRTATGAIEIVASSLQASVRGGQEATWVKTTAR